MRTFIFGIFAAISATWPGEPPAAALPLAVFHDNEAPAGRLVDGVLRVSLKVQEADWRPYGPDEPGLMTYAFSQVGGEPMIPAPYLRAELGTRVEVTIQNTLDSTLVVHGLGERKSAYLEPWTIGPGATATHRFLADAEGTFYYWARAGQSNRPDRAPLVDNQREGVFLTGALVITGPEMPDPIDEIMIIGVRTQPRAPAVLTINGRPWPYTKRLQYDMGQTVHWRLINASGRGHPMHLRGFFYDIDAKGDNDHDEIFWASQRRKAVTEEMSVGETLAISWTPNRPGGWIFHCHISGHVGPNYKPLGQPADRARQRELTFLGNPNHDPAHHVEGGMGGLMMGMYINPSPEWQPDERPRRQMRLIINSDSTPAPAGTPLEPISPYRRTFSPILAEGPSDPAPDSVRLPGSTLVMHEGEPTSVWVINRSTEPTQIHWHGLEIESPFDGVVGVGGYAGMPTPPIMPADSFEMRFTPPRPGSFMYHTHMNDIRQQGAGLYGPIVVTPKDREWDPETDRIYILGGAPDVAGTVVNGKTVLPPIRLEVGQSYRFRLMTITVGPSGTFELLRSNGAPSRWTVVAKDGADLPEHLRERVPSRQTVRVGETYDVLVIPRVPESLLFSIRSVARNGPTLNALQPIEVVAAGG
jgi:FtsP/CotA-like multicopper oxidase with cupredoxin domain